MDPKKMKARMKAIQARAQALATKAELSPEESDEIKALASELASIQARLTALAIGETEMDEEAAAEGPAPTEEEPVAEKAAATNTTKVRAVITGGDAPGASKRTGGFSTFAGKHGNSYLAAVRNAAFGGTIDPRLAALTTTDGPSAGYAAPPDYDATIMRTIDEMPFSLRNLCDVLPTSANRVIRAIDQKRPWQTGGVAVAPLAEAAQHVRSTPKLDRLDIEIHKLAAFVEMTDELEADAPQVQSLVTTKFAEGLVYALNEYIINGNGVNVPKGILQSGSLVTQAKESSQSAASIIAANVTNMFSRLHPQAQRGAVWLVSPDAYAQLPLMTIGNQPVFVPPSGLEAAPFGTMLGRPVYVSEECATMGTINDIILVDLKSYLLCERKSGEITSSAHFMFDRDTNCIKIVARYGGSSKWTSTLAAKNGSGFTQSNVVVLATRP